jgi:hypothetical protein
VGVDVVAVEGFGNADIENDRMARARVTGQKVYGVLVSLVIVLLAVAVVTLAAHMTLI